jgi:hypothetical protein
MGQCFRAKKRKRLLHSRTVRLSAVKHNIPARASGFRPERHSPQTVGVLMMLAG